MVDITWVRTLDCLESLCGKKVGMSDSCFKIRQPSTGGVYEKLGIMKINPNLHHSAYLIKSKTSHMWCKLFLSVNVIELGLSVQNGP